MDVMSRSSVREYLVITELYKGGKRVLQTKQTRAAFSMELLFDMQTYAMTLFDTPPERASTRSSSKEIVYRTRCITVYGKAIEQAPSMKRTVNMHLLEHHGWTCAIMNACRLWADGGMKHSTISISHTGHMSMANCPRTLLKLLGVARIYAKVGLVRLSVSVFPNSLESLRPEKLSRNAKNSV